jgi:hypothetical protein
LTASLADSLEHLESAQNAELDFTRILELHLRTGQELAEAEMARTRDTALKQWARALSRERTKERKVLSNMVPDVSGAGGSDLYYREVMERIKREPLPVAGELPREKIFASIMDHIGVRTIYLADTYARMSNSVLLKKWARSLSASHKKERETLRIWLEP